MAKQYWLVKSEPFKYSWDQFVKDGQTVWDGVRNYQARNNLRAMQIGDPVLFYHSNEGLCIVGIAEVTCTAYPDPSSDNPNWLVVELKPQKAFKQPVSLKSLKEKPEFEQLSLIKQSRLSVCPIRPEEFKAILKLGQ